MAALLQISIGSRDVVGKRAIAEWQATVHCEAAQRDQAAGRLRGSFEARLESLRDIVAE